MTLWGDWGEWGFWLAAGGMTFLVAGLMLIALVKGRARTTPTAAYDLQVYRDQLREIDKDLARGTITEDEARRVRTEVSRRVLEADRALAASGGAASAPPWASWTAGVGMVVLCAGAIWLYTDVGAPGYPDMPIAERLAVAKTLQTDRPSQKEAEAAAADAFIPPQPDPRAVQLVQQLRAAVAKHPDDLRGQQFLMQNEANIGNYRAAYLAAQRIIAIKGAKADAADYAHEASLMVLAAAGYVSPQAEAEFEKTLKLDPENGAARFYMGLMYAQTGRPDLGFRLWEPLLRQSPPDAPWVAPIRAQIESMAAAAGIRYQLAPAQGAPGQGTMPGPSAADMKAAQNMSPAERKEMIRGMVQGLAERLDTEGGSPQEWARLIGAYGVLGEADKRAEAVARARKAFADKPDALALIEGAARQAGMGAPAAPATAPAAPATAPAAPTTAPAPTPAPSAPPKAGAMSVAPATPPALTPTPPASTPPGATAEDVKAAEQMTPEARRQMIDDMVTRLNDKLATQGGTASEWARLIGAYGVLGNHERAGAIWTEAQTRFKDHPDQLALIRAAAEKAGVAPKATP